MNLNLILGYLLWEIVLYSHTSKNIFYTNIIGPRIEYILYITANWLVCTTGLRNGSFANKYQWRD